MQDTGNYKALYFVRNKADRRSPIDQCQDLFGHLEDTGFETWVISSDTNYLIFYGKDLNDT